MPDVTAFLPCREGSQRVVRKNVRPFPGYPGGLIDLKLRQLARCRSISRILVSTDDAEVMEAAESARSWSEVQIDLHERPPELATSLTSTDAVIRMVAGLVEPSIHVLWTHVTSPFCASKHYDEMVASYFEKLEQGTADSLVSVRELRGFVWDENGPINYDRSVEKWPRTQTLPSLYEINNAAFMASGRIYAESGDRIGERPALHVMGALESFDIDWQEDFDLAAKLAGGGVTL